VAPLAEGRRIHRQSAPQVVRVELLVGLGQLSDERAQRRQSHRHLEMPTVVCGPLDLTMRRA
jgi:hypothetical protein